MATQKPTVADTALAQQLDRFIHFSHRHESLVLDVPVLRRLSGLALPAASEPGYQHFLDTLGDGLVPVCNMVPWLKLEKKMIDPARYQALLDLVEPVEQFARTFVAPPAFGSKKFRNAEPAVKSTIAKSVGNASLRISPETIRALHQRLLAGDTQMQAAITVGISQNMAVRIRKREGASLWNQFAAVWQETFGAQPVGEFKQGYRPMLSKTRSDKDIKNAALLRRVFELLKDEVGQSKGAMNRKAAAALDMTESQVRKLILKQGGRFGPETEKAWLATFGADH